MGYVQKLSRSSQNKSINLGSAHEVKRYTQHIEQLVQGVVVFDEDENTAQAEQVFDDHTAQADQWNLVWRAAARLVDMYTFSRMLRRDNTNICIFYGGANHAGALYGAFMDIPGAELIDSYTREDVTYDYLE